MNIYNRRNCNTTKLSLSRDVVACYKYLGDIISMHQGKDHYILIVFVPCYRSYISLSLSYMVSLKSFFRCSTKHFTRVLLNLLSLWKEVVVVPTVKICLKDLMSSHHILSKQFFSVALVCSICITNRLYQYWCNLNNGSQVDSGNVLGKSCWFNVNVTIPVQSPFDPHQASPITHGILIKFTP